MTRITFIGSGSIGFTRTLVRDILTFPRLTDAELVLMDIDAERLEFAERSVKRIIELGNYPATVKTTLSRAEALQGADVVMVTILAGGVQVWRHDIEIPKQFGIDINVGDTRGPSGIFRALRTIPEMLAIAKDMEKYCPNAMMLNYTNPMAISAVPCNAKVASQSPGCAIASKVPPKCWRVGLASPTKKSITSVPASITWHGTCALTTKTRAFTR